MSMCVAVRTLARKAKKRLGPLFNKALLRVLTDGVCYDVTLFMVHIN
jgi:hypothetical protein